MEQILSLSWANIYVQYLEAKKKGLKNKAATLLKEFIDILNRQPTVEQR